MKVLIIGNGGREHAMTWRCAQSKSVKKIYIAPGNAGTELEDKTENVVLDIMDFQGLINFVKKRQIELTIVGPEAPLAAGIVDAFEKANLHCFGPTKAAAQLEASKAFSKDFMLRHHIPTAKFAYFTNQREAINYVQQQSNALVIKADGLAAGKGVIIAHNKQQAIKAIEKIMGHKSFGDAGTRIIIEEFLTGTEASFIAITDGQTHLPMPTSQDHKTRDDGNKGPNTGGMGAISPSPMIDDELKQTIMDIIINPTLAGMASEGYPYRGFLYAGLMIDDKQQVKVLEFNCRLGDPETQVILSRLQSDFFKMCYLAQHKRLNEYQPIWNPLTALGVVLAAKGYPENYQKGVNILGLDKIDQTDSKVFHAGTQLVSGKIIGNGGRLLCLTSLGQTLEDAYNETYKNINLLNYNSFHFRKDIGKQLHS